MLLNVFKLGSDMFELAFLKDQSGSIIENEEWTGQEQPGRRRSCCYSSRGKR